MPPLEAPECSRPSARYYRLPCRHSFSYEVCLVRGYFLDYRFPEDENVPTKGFLVKIRGTFRTACRDFTMDDSKRRSSPLRGPNRFPLQMILRCSVVASSLGNLGLPSLH